MRDRYDWQPDEPFEYNLAVHKIPPFIDKLHALHDPASYLAGPATWYENWAESPGGIMLAPYVANHEKEDALRTDFAPIARYVEHDRIHDTVYDGDQRLRYEHLQAFIIMNAIESDRKVWANRQDQPYAINELLPVHIANIMFETWIIKKRPHSNAVHMLISKSVSRMVA